jgi:hypothetical protein
MNWIKAEKSPIRFSFGANASLIIHDIDPELAFHSEVEKVRRMEIERNQKIDILKSKEQNILRDVATKRFAAIQKYAKESQHTDIKMEDVGAPEGAVEWNNILAGDTTGTPTEHDVTTTPEE